MLIEQLELENIGAYTEEIPSICLSPPQKRK